MKSCIINFASGNWYPTGQDRLRTSLARFSPNIPLLAFSHESELECQPHHVIPYAFKAYAFKKAMDRGYELILWCDAAVWAIRPIEPLFEYLANHSHVFFVNSNIGRFVSDACLKGFNLSRDDAMTMPELTGCCMGLNTTTPLAQTFFGQYWNKANDGFSFKGAWNNANHEVSDDPRCAGHRHDQSCASIIACRLGMEYLVPHETYFSYWAPQVKDSVVLVAQGM